MRSWSKNSLWNHNAPQPAALEAEASSIMRELSGARCTVVRLYTLRIKIGTNQRVLGEHSHCWTRLWCDKKCMTESYVHWMALNTDQRSYDPIKQVKSFQSPGDVFPLTVHHNTRLGPSPWQEVVVATIKYSISGLSCGSTGGNIVIQLVTIVT